MAHYGTAYHKPHPKSRLSFLVRSIEIWCEWRDRQPSIFEDEQVMTAVEDRIRKGVVQRVGASDLANVEHFTAAEVAAFVGYWRSQQLTDDIERLRRKRPGEGNRRREVPTHLPLRPHRTIIAKTLADFRVTHPEKSVSALREALAKYLNDGVPACEASGRMTDRSIRSAEEAYWCTGKDLPVETRRAKHRAAAWGAPHVWDRTALEVIIGAEHLSFGRDDLMRMLLAAENEATAAPLRSLREIYTAARKSKRFRSLAGVELASAVNAVFGLGQLVARWPDDRGVAVPAGKAASGFADASA